MCKGWGKVTDTVTSARQTIEFFKCYVVASYSAKFNYTHHLWQPKILQTRVAPDCGLKQKRSVPNLIRYIYTVQTSYLCIGY